MIPAVRVRLERRFPFFVIAFAILTAFSYIEATGVAAEFRKLVLAAIIARLVVKLDELISGPTLSRCWVKPDPCLRFHAPVAILTLLCGLNWLQAALTAIAAGGVTFIIYERPLDRYGHRLASELTHFRSTSVGASA